LAAQLFAFALKMVKHGACLSGTLGAGVICSVEMVQTLGSSGPAHGYDQ
jgi:hypothetical protein